MQIDDIDFDDLYDFINTKFTSGRVFQHDLIYFISIHVNVPMFTDESRNIINVMIDLGYITRDKAGFILR